MAKLKFTVHPLFVIFGIYFAFTGKVFSFLIFTFTALVHELGHAFVASSLGFQLNRLVLMPYGATVSGDLSDLSYSDEIKIALAGPLTNLFSVVLFVCLWWVFPQVYPYTELAVLANLTLATVNLLPSYPLDGGRILLATLSLYFSRKTAEIIAKVTGLLFALLIFVAFIYSIVISSVNFSLLFFSGFMFFGNVFVSKENKYIRLIESLTLGDLKKGKTVKSVAISPKTTVRDLLRLQSPSQILEVDMYSYDQVKICRLNGEEVLKILCEGSLNSSVFDEYKRILGKR